MNDTIDRNYGNILAIVGRLKPGVSLSAAQAEIDQATKTIKQLHPERGGSYQDLFQPCGSMSQDRSRGRWR